MALIFRDSVEAPVRCAVEISEAVKLHPEIHLRMGIHSGPVSEVTDVNERTNIAGAGIDIAQRVMDCGDAGHILLSKHVADDLAPHPRWNRYVSAYSRALLYLSLNNPEEAIQWLEQGVANHEGRPLTWIKVDPLLDPLRGDPRFEALVQKVVGAEHK
jgi:class 3 adenylate cyclase